MTTQIQTKPKAEQRLRRRNSSHCWTVFWVALSIAIDYYWNLGFDFDFFTLRLTNFHCIFVEKSADRCFLFWMVNITIAKEWNWIAEIRHTHSVQPFQFKSLNAMRRTNRNLTKRRNEKSSKQKPKRSLTVCHFADSNEIHSLKTDGSPLGNCFGHQIWFVWSSQSCINSSIINK